MAQDVFYALHEVFTHSACSEKQFLNLIDTKLSKYIEEAQNQHYDTLSDLSHSKEILYYHLKYLKRVDSFIRQIRDHSKWPKSTSDKQQRQNALVLEYFVDLAEQAEMSYNRCQSAIAVLMNSMSIAEAEKGILQAERLGKLTFLAFIFVPLSFTTSFFGMNFRELGAADSPSLWVWFVMSSSVLLSSMLFFYIDLHPYVHVILTWWRNFYDHHFRN